MSKSSHMPVFPDAYLRDNYRLTLEQHAPVACAEARTSVEQDRAAKVRQHQSGPDQKPSNKETI